MTLVGESNQWYRTDYSTDFINWFPLTTNQLVVPEIEIFDPAATNSKSRFYRATRQTDN